MEDETPRDKAQHTLNALLDDLDRTGFKLTGALKASRLLAIKAQYGAEAVVCGSGILLAVPRLGAVERPLGPATAT